MNKVIVSDLINGSFENDSEILYLGYGGLSLNSNFENLLIVDNPWSKEQNKELGTLEIDKAMEFCLTEISDILNKFHDVNKCELYWQTIISPWILSVITLYIEKKGLFNNLPKEYTYTFKTACNQNDPFIFRDFKDFNTKKFDESFQHNVFLDVAKESVVDIEFVDIPLTEKAVVATPPVSKVKKLLTKLINGLAFTLNLKKKLTFISSPYMSRVTLLKLFVCNVPYFSFLKREVEINSVSVKNIDMRNELIANIPVCSPEKNSLLKFCIKLLPLSYLENYQEIAKGTKLKYPNKVSVINTAVSDVVDDEFKIWSAEQRELGAKYVINQHGGLYGLGKYMPLEKLQIANSDQFLTWGWSNCNKTIPVGALKLKFKKKKNRQQSKIEILVILLGNPKYPYWCTSVPCGSALVKYFNDQFGLFEALPLHLRANTKFRFGINDFNWGFETEFKRRYSINTDTSDYVDSIENAGLCICTYNATTMLETIALDIPTIMYWDPALFSIRENAISIFDELKECGLLQDNPEHLAGFLDENIDDIDNWWGSHKVQEVRNKFMSIYGNKVDFELLSNKLKA